MELTYVQDPCSPTVRPCSPRQYKIVSSRCVLTLDPLLLYTMDSSRNLESLSYPQYEARYDASMFPNDGRQENPSLHLIQNHDTSPPGADTSRTTFTFPGQAEPSLQNSLSPGHINSIEENASRMLTQFPVNFQGHEQDAGLYPPSPPSSDSPSPSHVSQLRPSLPGTLLFSSWMDHSTELRGDLRPLGPIVPNTRYLRNSILTSHSNSRSFFFSTNLIAHARKSCARKDSYERTRTSGRIFIYHHAIHPSTLAGSQYPL